MTQRHNPDKPVTPWNYTNYTCRCTKCREAWNQFQRQRRAKKKAAR